MQKACESLFTSFVFSSPMGMPYEAGKGFGIHPIPSSPQIFFPKNTLSGGDIWIILFKPEEVNK
jgi:hypothetical protein